MRVNPPAVMSLRKRWRRSLAAPSRPWRGAGKPQKKQEQKEVIVPSREYTVDSVVVCSMIN